jgi:hypothetical protein
MTSLGLGVGCRGLHSVTSANPTVYRERIVLLTTLGELTRMTLRRSLSEGGSAEMWAYTGGVGGSLVFGINSSIGFTWLLVEVGVANLRHLLRYEPLTKFEAWEMQAKPLDRC